MASPHPREPLSLPQPPAQAPSELGETAGASRYTYVPYDALEKDWHGDGGVLRRSIQSAADNNGGESASSIEEDGPGRYAAGSLVWVLLSKGRKATQIDGNGFGAQCRHMKKRNKNNKRNGKAVGGENGGTGNTANAADEKGSRDDDKNGSAEHHAQTTPTMNQSRKEFYRRARVVSDDDEVKDSAGRGDRRVLVRYEKGSTYRVHAYNLLPVLEPCLHESSSIPPLVVLVPETNVYRRVARVHTTPDDSFLEVGCDYGITVDKIQKSLADAGDVPRVWPAPEDGGGDDSSSGGAGTQPGSGRRSSCLGVDRSQESIDIANERYPDCLFSLVNVLRPDEMSSLRALCEKSLANSSPSVVCVDVNGNREIDGVLDVLRMVVDERWRRQPRLIIVKSRFLYWEVKDRR